MVEYIESTVPVDVGDEQMATIRSLAAEFKDDPSIGPTWDEVKARLTGTSGGRIYPGRTATSSST